MKVDLTTILETNKAFRNKLQSMELNELRKHCKEYGIKFSVLRELQQYACLLNLKNN
jgi:hypothetical protein